MWNLRLAVSAFVCLFVCLCVVCPHLEGRLREVGSKACHGTYPTSKLTKNDILKSPQKISRCPGRPNTRTFVILVPRNSYFGELYFGEPISGNVLLLALPSAPHAVHGCLVSYGSQLDWFILSNLCPECNIFL